jgi:hypothetical protein
MPVTYKTHYFCSKCGEYFLKKDADKFTRRSKTGQLLHECGWRIRERGRRHNNMESVREDARNHKAIILPNSTVKDILLNKEKLESILKSGQVERRLKANT